MFHRNAGIAGALLVSLSLMACGEESASSRQAAPRAATSTPAGAPISEAAPAPVAPQPVAPRPVAPPPVAAQPVAPPVAPQPAAAPPVAPQPAAAPSSTSPCSSFADSTYIPSMTSTILQRSDGLRVELWHAREAAHAVYLRSSDGQYAGNQLYRAPASFFGGDIQVLGVSREGYKIALDPKESQVVTGTVDRAILHVCVDRWRQVGGRTDIW